MMSAIAVWANQSQFKAHSSEPKVKQPTQEEVELLAQTVTKEGTVAHAIGSVVVYSPKYLITADEAYYDYESGDLELIGNITMLEGVSYASRSGHTKLNLKTDEGTSEPLFFFDEAVNIWLKCENAILSPSSYIAQKSIVSSCNTQDPDWKIAFTTGEHDKENKWMHLYNPVFYAGDTPFFYLPYFSFSTDTTRRTGLLRPDIGFGSEGLFYLQPIYFAPEKDWDVEVSPQIRTSRGEGIHGTYRFVDSQYSKGTIETGYFKEKESYVQEKNLKNNEHYGYRIMYDRSALLSTKYDNIEDGLWIDFNYLNDIDYYNTINDKMKAYNRLVTSQMNYYVKRDQDYVGIYGKYYIDTTLVSNDSTLQQLPTLNYHRFSNPLLFDNLLYSVDYNAKNYSRVEGVTAFQNEVSTPLTVHFSFLEDYLYVSASENIYMTHVSYGNGAEDGNYGQYFNNYHKISMFTDLAKAYDNFFHTLYFGMEQTLPSYRKEKGTWDYTYKGNELIPLTMEEKNTAFKLKQFFYDSEGDKRVSHSVKQTYYSEHEYKYGDLENDVKVYLTPQFIIGNNILYSHEYSQLARTQTSVTYKDDLYSASLLYTYQDTPTSTSGALSSKNYNYMTLIASTNYFENFNTFASVNYDLNDDLFKSWSFGIKKLKKCWDYSITYKDLTLPSLTSSGADSVNRQGVMFLFNFYPLGNINYEVTTSETEQKL